MKRKRPLHRLEIDDSPPNPGQKKVEAEILRFRAWSESFKPWIKAQIDVSVREAMREMKLKKSAK